MKKEVEVSERVRFSKDQKTMLVGAFIVFCLGLWLVLTSDTISTAPSEFKQYSAIVPLTQEIEPLGGGVVSIRYRAWGYSGGIKYTEYVPIPRKCFIYRGGRLSSSSWEQKGDWLRATYYLGDATHLDECPRNTSVLIRLSEMRRWKGKFEALEKDEVDRAAIFSRWQ